MAIKLLNPFNFNGTTVTNHVIFDWTTVTKPHHFWWDYSYIIFDAYYIDNKMLKFNQQVNSHTKGHLPGHGGK